MTPCTLYGFSGSGNCWKPAALLRALGRPFNWVEVDILSGQSRTPEFLRKNPNGKIPLLEVGPRQYLAESNAMLCYLAEGTPWLPDDRWQRAKVMEWLFFEQYSHEPYIATVRFWLLHTTDPAAYAERIAQARPRGEAALQVMQQALAQQRFLLGNAPTIADLALFAYTHVADEAGYRLDGYPAIERWIADLIAIGIAPMPRSAAGQPATAASPG